MNINPLLHQNMNVDRTCTLQTTFSFGLIRLITTCYINSTSIISNDLHKLFKINNNESIQNLNLPWHVFWVNFQVLIIKASNRHGHIAQK